MQTLGLRVASRLHHPNMADSDSGSDFEVSKLKCIWCGKPCKKLVEGKKYCLKCEANMIRECRSCHRPIDTSTLFKYDEQRCNACFKKLEKARLKRQEKRNAEKQPAKTSQSSPAKRETQPKFYAVLPIVKIVSDDDDESELNIHEE